MTSRQEGKKYFVGTFSVCLPRDTECDGVIISVMSSYMQDAQKRRPGEMAAR